MASSGPRPAECVDRLRELGWPGVVGNFDRISDGLPDALGEELSERLQRQVDFMTDRLGEERLAWLEALPMEWRDGDRVALVHAVPGDLWGIVHPTAEDAELRATFGPLGARVAVYCHIHIPFVREVGDLTVPNAGSAGAPFDGDARASYLLIEDGSVTIRRVEYDVERAAADAFSSGMPEPEWAARVYREAPAPSF